VQTLASVVSSLQKEQSGLLNRVTSVEEKVAEPSLPLIAAIPSMNPPPAMIPPTNPAPAVSPPVTLPLAAAPPPSMPDLLLPHLPAIAQGPPPDAEPEPPPAALKPPKLQLGSADTTEPVTVPREDEGPLTTQKRARLVKRLRNHQQQGILIRAAAENAQAVKLAISLKSVFREAGWTVGDIEMVNRPLPAHTLLLSTGVFPPPQEFVAAYGALAGTGFLVTSDLDPNQGRQRVVVSVGPIR